MSDLWMRPYNAQEDLKRIYALGEVAYAEDYRRTGMQAAAGLEREQRVALTLGALGRVLPALRDAETGFVWEQGERILAFVCAARLGLAGHHWSIETVATAPDARGRGLATQALKALLEEIRLRGGTVCSLKVRSDNQAALHLYRNLGFAIAETTRQMKGAVRPGRSEKPPAMNGFQVEQVSIGGWHDAWAERHALGIRETPAAAQGLLPASVGDYRRPRFARWVAPALARMSGRRVEQWLITRDRQLVATLSVNGDRTGKKAHEIDVRLDPEFAGQVAEGLIGRGLGRLSSLPPAPALVETRASSQDLEAALLRRGFEIINQWHRMGLRLA